MVAPENISRPEMKRRLEKMHHDTLREAYDENLIRFFVDFKRLNKIGSPVYDPWENVLPLLFLILGSLIVLLFQGVIMGTLALLIAMALFVLMVRPYMAARLKKRTETYMLKSPEHWDKVWKVGGVAVTLNHMSSIGCVAPTGNWKVFTRDNLTDVVALRKSDKAEAAKREAAGTQDEVKPVKAEPEILGPETNIVPHDDDESDDSPRRRRRRRRRDRDD